MKKEVIFENYEEITQLGKGTGVWLVLDKKSKKVFIKKCRRDFNMEVYERISRIQDSHIPRIYQCQESEGMLYVIEEYIAGETLMEKMEKGYIFSERETIEILIQLCEALECLHIRLKPIIHRDIKPSNIMISNDRVVKLIDYNAARCYAQGATEDTKYMGTPGYAAPEQYGFSQSDMRTDIYALGVLLNYMLLGRHPNEKIASGDLGKIVRKCIQIDPGKRYDSVNSIKVELKKRMEKTEKTDLYASCWPIPGFRSKKVWKIVLAILGYFLIGGGVFLGAMRLTQGNHLKSITFFILNILWMAGGAFLLVAIITDYAGIGRKIPIIKSRNKVLHWLGCVLWGILELGILAGIWIAIEMAMRS